MRILRAAPIIALTVAISLSLPVSAHAGISEIFGGTTNLSLVASPKTVKAWRTVGSLKHHGLGRYEDYASYFNKSGTGVLVPTNLVTQLSKFLLDERNYSSVRDDCVYQPELVLTFSDGTRNLDLFFSTGCRVMLVKTADRGSEQAPATVDTTITKHSELVRIMKQIFPNDDAILALKEN
ncbi:MAG: hypothetical protein ABSA83_24290 [Verrucomicrobiota bacterium]|jgi:hypothetical protein